MWKTLCVTLPLDIHKGFHMYFFILYKTQPLGCYTYHHMQITWLSYFGSENQGLPLRSWFVTCWLWRHIPIVTSLAVPSSCVITQTPMGTNSGTRCRKRKFPLLFVNCDRGRIEIDHLYGLRCSGWYCNPEQHSLCRPARPQAAARRPAQLALFWIAVPTTPARTVSWSIPITNDDVTSFMQICHNNDSNNNNYNSNANQYFLA